MQRWRWEFHKGGSDYQVFDLGGSVCTISSFFSICSKIFGGSADTPDPPLMTPLLCITLYIQESVVDKIFLTGHPGKYYHQNLKEVFWKPLQKGCFILQLVFYIFVIFNVLLWPIYDTNDSQLDRDHTTT